VNRALGLVSAFGLAYVLVASHVEARPGAYCTSTKACEPLELCVTTDPWASAGTCQRLKLFP
jgi:hypothetical protein